MGLNGVGTALPDGKAFRGVIGAKGSSSETPETMLGTDELLIVRALWAVGLNIVAKLLPLLLELAPES